MSIASAVVASARARLSCGGVLFDLDGVLIDSTPAVERVWSRWALERGFDPAATTLLAHGRPSLETLRELLPGADHETENRELERREMADIAGIVPLPGAAELLAALPPEQWAIVTSCTLPLAEVRLRASGLPWPRRLVTASDIARGKPAPDGYLRGAALLDLSPEQCLVVEDAPAGVRAGKAAGARVLGLATTIAAAQLRAAGADWTCANCAALRLTGAGARLRFRLAKIPPQVVS